ncbi:MAG TPA: alanine racemase C-terminal domain-containing protein, partial [Parvularculaceae bacterium]|nr:alanine racemase C-terminal domain-containing protein [Parvularculaceae bacterium]
AQAWSAQRRSEPAALHIDTGMNRLGAPISEIGAIKALSVNFDLVMSHLACASEPDHPMNARQRALFEEVARAFPNARRSLSASGGALMADAYHYDLVRPGIALYGASPFDDGPDPRLRPVARLTAPVVQLRRVATGETAGYGATRRFEKDALLATVALGYGDGLPRNASNRGAAYLGGAVCPIAGRVSMDLTILDASNAPRPIEIGDRAEFFGPAFAIEDAARHAGVSVYELLTGLGARLDRRYLSGVSHERRRDGGKVQ